MTAIDSSQRKNKAALRVSHSLSIKNLVMLWSLSKLKCSHEVRAKVTLGKIHEIQDLLDNFI